MQLSEVFAAALARDPGKVAELMAALQPADRDRVAAAAAMLGGPRCGGGERLYVDDRFHDDGSRCRHRWAVHRKAP
jgi:hypothetical protein